MKTMKTCVLLFYGYSSILLNGAFGEKPSAGKLSCKDEAGNPVDWFLAYKLPRDPHAADPSLQVGGAYFFMTPRSTGWERSKNLIDQTTSIIEITLQPLYQNKSKPELLYILYNDQPPNDHPVLFNGHTKGVIVSSVSGGFWLPHSVPHFPNVDSSIHYPPGGHENGQMFLCLSLNVTMMDSIGDALLYTKPHFFNYSISKPLMTLHPKLTEVVINNGTKTAGPWFTNIQLEAGDGDSFTVFAKAPKFRKDIYVDWIAPKLSTSLDVQSWLNGAHPLYSNCASKFQVHNIQNKTISGITFSTVNDHSKWSVGTDQPWTCIADLNRMKPQKSRGGVAVCFANKAIWSAMKACVTKVQPCNQIPRQNSRPIKASFYSRSHKRYQYYVN